ncbi:hypothetical protein AU467_29915 [Mesorhizobium loti]|uniref:Uncharacterized protein n=1 Tax=Rhizobium loti TaxID=381 RepID=A0A124GFS0_RHILI|nr:hypothetical protein AU467_29915 [Mesorhizobium loti]
MPILPGAIITWTSTGTASMPWKATVRTRATMLFQAPGCRLTSALLGPRVMSTQDNHRFRI